MSVKNEAKLNLLIITLLFWLPLFIAVKKYFKETFSTFAFFLKEEYTGYFKASRCNFDAMHSGKKQVV